MVRKSSVLLSALWLCSFLAPPADAAKCAKAAEPAMLLGVPILITATGCLLIFFFSNTLYRFAEQFVTVYAQSN